MTYVSLTQLETRRRQIEAERATILRTEPRAVSPRSRRRRFRLPRPFRTAAA